VISMVVKNKYEFAGRYYATVDNVEVASDKPTSDEEFEALRPTDTGDNMPDDNKYTTLAQTLATEILTKLQEEDTLERRTLADVMFSTPDKKVILWQ